MVVVYYWSHGQTTMHYSSRNTAVTVAERKRRRMEASLRKIAKEKKKTKMMRMWRKHIVTKFWKLSKAIVIDVVVVVVHSKHIKGHKTTNTAIAAVSSSVNAVTLVAQGRTPGKICWDLFYEDDFWWQKISGDLTTWQSVWRNLCLPFFAAEEHEEMQRRIGYLE